MKLESMFWPNSKFHNFILPIYISCAALIEQGTLIHLVSLSIAVQSKALFELLCLPSGGGYTSWGEIFLDP